jgi:hypothetical protein
VLEARVVKPLGWRKTLHEVTRHLAKPLRDANARLEGGAT